MHLFLDLTELRSTTARAVRQLRELPGKMKQAGKYWAAYERTTHAYQNRTGDLQRSTVSFLSKGEDRITIVLQMGMFYASYVNNLGYSNIDYAAQMCGVMIEDICERAAQGVK